VIRNKVGTKQEQFVKSSSFEKYWAGCIRQGIDMTANSKEYIFVKSENIHFLIYPVLPI
jgi:hypothetical protein